MFMLTRKCHIQCSYSLTLNQLFVLYINHIETAQSNIVHNRYLKDESPHRGNTAVCQTLRTAPHHIYCWTLSLLLLFLSQLVSWFVTFSFYFPCSCFAAVFSFYFIFPRRTSSLHLLHPTFLPQLLMYMLCSRILEAPFLQYSCCVWSPASPLCCHNWIQRMSQLHSNTTPSRRLKIQPRNSSIENNCNSRT